jgi:hypothetical protein
LAHLLVLPNPVENEGLSLESHSRACKLRLLGGKRAKFGLKNCDILWLRKDKVDLKARKKPKKRSFQLKFYLLFR